MTAVRASGAPVDGAAAGARSIDAFHLPGLPAAASAEWEVLSVPGTDLVVRVPVLEPDHIDRVCERLAAARAERLPDGDARGVAAVLARSARRMRRAALEEANRAAIAGLAGLSAPMVDRILDGMAAGWSEESLTGLLTAEFGEPSVPHRFAPDPARPGIRTRAVAPDVAFHVFAGNVPGVAVTSMIRSLLVGSAVIGKTAREGPLLPALFARALQQEDPALAQCLAVTWWPGGSARLETRVLERAKLAVVYGGADAVRAVRSLAPASTRVVVHGPGVSVGLILKGALTAANAARLAGDAALAIATFDQRGCTSPVALIVEEGGEMSPARFAAALGEELDRLAVILPAGAPAPATAARRRQVLDAAELRGEAAGAAAIRGTGWGIALRTSVEPGDFCTDRVVQVVGVPDLDAALAALRPLAGSLQTVGIEADGPPAASLAEAVAELGASRVTSIGAMPWPPPAWRHDGAHPLRELVRWADLDL